MNIALRRKLLVWRIIRSTANDNRTSPLYWLKILLPWSVLVGTILAWGFFG